MKIKKLKNGYRINLSDTEMALLRMANEEGMATLYEINEENENSLAFSTWERRIFNQIYNGEREWL
jgi:ABC-type molybdate transport system substrate-binding protein